MRAAALAACAGAKSGVGLLLGFSPQAETVMGACCLILVFKQRDVWKLQTQAQADMGACCLILVTGHRQVWGLLLGCSLSVIFEQRHVWGLLLGFSPRAEAGMGA